MRCDDEFDRSKRRYECCLPHGFDAIPETKQLAAIDWLAAHHVDRILTHGGPLSTPIETTLPHLQALIAHAAEKQITILPGGGITSQNAATISEQLGVKGASWHQIDRLLAFFVYSRH